MFLSKEIDEKLIKAFEIYNKKLCESLPTVEELKDITFSESFEKKMQKLIKAQKKSYFYLINTVGKRVAIIVLALIISLTATTFSVKAIRESVIEFITETFEKFTKVTVQNEEYNSDTEIEFVKTVPEYIPDGYKVESEIEIDGLYQVYYINREKNSIDYCQELYCGTIKRINTEDIEYQDLLINSYEGVFYNNGMNTVVFADETYMYTVYGQVSKDELIKIAESIKIK